MRLNDLSTQYCRWLATTQDLSEHTIRAYRDDIQALLDFLEADCGVESLTPSVFYEFLDHLVGRGRTSTTIRRRICGVRGFCIWLVHCGHIEVNPLADFNVRFSRPRRLPRAVSPTDLRQLVRHLSSEAAHTKGRSSLVTGNATGTQMTTLLAVLLLVGTGMRVGELTSTKLAQVDLPSRTIRVLGKGSRERMVYFPNECVVALLARHLECRRGAGESTEPLLLNRSGNPLTASALRTRLDRAGVAAGLTYRLTPHMLRHTAATQLIESGVDIRFVQRLLGHASLTTTEIYTHIADRSLRQAVAEADVLGRFLTLT